VKHRTERQVLWTVLKDDPEVKVTTTPMIPIKNQEVKIMTKGTHEIKGNQVIITFDPNSKEVSKSGKSIILASSGGFQYKGDIGVSYNITKKKD